MRKAIITVGLGFGDESKGATVDYLCREHNANLVIRYSGGSQCGHNVELPDGRRHTFSQLGSGTLSGVETYLGHQVIINPPAMSTEMNHLRSVFNIDATKMLTVHPKCLVSTILHQKVNHLREISRRNNKHGSCGHGIGETRNYWLKHGDEAIFAEDLYNVHILDYKLQLLKQRLVLELNALVDQRTHEEQIIDIAKEISNIRTYGLAMWYNNYIALFKLSSEIPECDIAVFEGAQGVLLDESYGFHPYTTWSNVTPQFAVDMAYGLDDVTILGITRAFTTRHGAGPLPTFNSGLTKSLVDIGNPTNRWQGEFKVGHLDLPLLTYAAKICKLLDCKLDGLVVSHLDQIDENYKVCTKYNKCYLSYHGDYSLPYCLGALEPIPMNLKNLEYAGKLLQTHDQDLIYENIDRNGLLDRLSGIAPVSIVSDGPTFKHRTKHMSY